MQSVEKTIHIIYEDEDILLVNKPNNLLVHQSKFGGNIDPESLCQLLNKERKEMVHPIHRLDRKTSGIILFSKKKEHIPMLQNQFHENQIKKNYLALVRGHILKEGSINSPIKPEDKTEYKEALSLYKPISRITVNIPVKPYQESRYTLLEMEPKTGRTHQLRKHCNKISNPIIGDPKYGNRHHNHMFIEKLKINTLFLHAFSLEFTHPTSALKNRYIAALPAQWQKMFTAFHWEIEVDYEFFK